MLGSLLENFVQNIGHSKLFRRLTCISQYDTLNASYKSTYCDMNPALMFDTSLKSLPYNVKHVLFVS